MKIPKKECKTIKEAEEYLNSYGVYIWHKGDDVNYIRYLLNIGCYVYVATAHDHRGYYLLKNSNDIWFSNKLKQFTTIVSNRPNKLMKFVKNGFNKYVRIVNIYEGD
jgi:uncharacterized pyridoxamine 5'-phosphate oxidase family protein